jgi:LPS-assembly protein
MRLCLLERKYIFFMLILSNLAWANFDSAQIINKLQWQPQNNMCQGAFLFSAVPKPAINSKKMWNVSAQQMTLTKATAETCMQGNVQVFNVKQHIYADKICMKNTAGQISSMILEKPLHYQEKNLFLTAQSGRWNKENQQWKFNDGLFRFRGHHRDVYWGSHQYATVSKDTLNIKKSLFTTCAVKNPSWTLRSNRLRLEKKKGMAYAHGVTLRWGSIPLFYLPYLKFPIDNKRHSGFLPPKFFYTQGLGFTQPYYWNIKPQMDLLWTFMLHKKRGLGLGAKWRYLSPYGSGNVAGLLLPQDTFALAFRDEQLLAPHAGKILNALQNISTQRYFAHWEHGWRSQPWTVYAAVNKLSDDYVPADLSSADLSPVDLPQANLPKTIANKDAWTIPSVFLLAWDKRSAHFEINVHHYQHLMPLWRNNFAAAFDRSPEILGSWKQPLWQGEFSWNSGLTHFSGGQQSFSENPVQPKGWRLWLEPHWQKNIGLSGMQLNTDVGLAYRYYDIQPILPKAENHSLIPMLSINLLVPKRQLNSGWSFQPQVYYHYLPYQKQENLPLFASIYQQNNTASFFSARRFTDKDLYGDDHSLRLGIQLHRSLEQGNVAIKVGQGYAFKKHQLCLKDYCAVDELTATQLSNLYISTEITHSAWKWTNEWSIPHRANISDIGKRLRSDVDYKRNEQQHFWLYYHQDSDPNGRIDTRFTNYGLGLNSKLSRSVTLSSQWSHYNDWRKSQEWQVGMVYHSCCWSLKLTASQYWLGEALQQQKYRRRYNLEFFLTGLGV